jgi:hypothetical protein
MYDIVICLGPNDISLFPKLIENVKHTIVGYNAIYVITSIGIKNSFETVIPNVTFVDETTFPFSKQYIDDKFKTPSRSGWYLQQLLKIYAPIVIKELLDHYLILDADVYFHKPVSFFENNKALLNTGTEHWTPYFEHMRKMDPSLFRVMNCSGICHLMPLKRKIVVSLLNKIELTHNKPFWEVFLNFVDPGQYTMSGASEYEMLFNYTILHFPDEYEIRKLIWKNTSAITQNYDGEYEACHHYNRTIL